MGVVERGAAVVFAEGLQVQLVEQVEEVDAQIQLGAFTFEERHGRGFSKAGINGLVARSPEGVAVQERRTSGATIKIGIADVPWAKRLSGRRADATACLGDNPRELTVIGLECVGLLFPADRLGHFDFDPILVVGDMRALAVFIDMGWRCASPRMKTPTR